MIYLYESPVNKEIWRRDKNTMVVEVFQVHSGNFPAVHINSSKLSIEGKLREKDGGSFELGFAI